ncbi:MAG: iron-containing alcohol dehydrogenase [Acidimicrobiales bacterium]
MSDVETVVVDRLNDLRTMARSSPEAASLHEIGVREVVRGPGAIHTLASVLERLGVASSSTVCLFCDTTPKSYGDGDVSDVVLHALRAHQTAMVRIAPRGPDGLVHANEATVADAVDMVRRTTPSVIVSVGSGTIVDIAKVVARELALTHVVVQTAASVNGFSDDQSVLLIKGVKRTTPSRWPDALLIDPEAVANAPLAMTRSGLGDELSLFSAGADWYLANAVGIDASFSPTIIAMMRRDIDGLLAASGEVGSGQPDAIALLASCLTAGGLAMGVAGRTAPSSGAEHLISHLLEMHAGASALASASHGSQVGAASVTAALIWARVREHLRGPGAQVSATNVATREQVLAAFERLDATGAMGEECWRVYERKATWIGQHLDDIRGVVLRWPDHDAHLERLLLAPEVVASSLRRARGAVTYDDLDPVPEPEAVEWTLAHCNLMRDRFTVVDLAQLLGLWNRSDAAAVLARQRELAR